MRHGYYYLFLLLIFFYIDNHINIFYKNIYIVIAILINNMLETDQRQWFLSQISNKFHRFQQITKQGEVNVNKRQTGKAIMVF